MSDRDHRIRVAAYHLWEGAGRPDQRSDEFWALAEARIAAEDEAAAGATEVRKKPTRKSVKATPAEAPEPKPAKSPKAKTVKPEKAIFEAAPVEAAPARPAPKKKAKK